MYLTLLIINRSEKWGEKKQVMADIMAWVRYVVQIRKSQEVNRPKIGNLCLKLFSIANFCYHQDKGLIFSKKYWCYSDRPKNVLRSILSFVFWIFPPSGTAMQLESANRTQFQNLFSRIVFSTFFGQWEKCIISEKKRPLYGTYLPM